MRELPAAGAGRESVLDDAGDGGDGPGRIRQMGKFRYADRMEWKDLLGVKRN